MDDASPDAAPSEPSADARADQPDLMTKAITVGVIGVGVALFEAALIPGMIIGVAAMLAPKALPKLGAGVQPIFRSAVRGAYKAGQRARHAFAEAQEQVHDIVAETNTEAAGSSGTMGPGDAVKA
ncbi:MAG: DUF5132 domain-containing protein [Pseudomonadota bacterium]